MPAVINLYFYVKPAELLPFTVRAVMLLKRASCPIAAPPARNSGGRLFLFDYFEIS